MSEPDRFDDMHGARPSAVRAIQLSGALDDLEVESAARWSVKTWGLRFDGEV